MTDIKQKLYNKVEILQLVASEFKWKIDRGTLYRWEKKGYLKSGAELKDGKRIVPLYTETNVTEFLELLNRLIVEKKVRYGHARRSMLKD